MKVSIEDIRRQYAELSDEGLLEIEREDLVEQARQCYDEEMARRRIEAPLPSTPPAAERIPDDLVVVTEYTSQDEAELARELVRAAGIQAWLGNERIVGYPRVLDRLPLLVAAGDLEFAREVLESKVSDEELTAEAVADISYIRHGVGAVRPCLYGGYDLLEFVQRAFGASVLEDSDGHVEVKIADSVVVLELSDSPPSDAERGQVFVYVPDVDEAYECALEAGGGGIAKPADMPYQERRARVTDPFGNTWWISTYTGVNPGA